MRSCGPRNTDSFPKGPRSTGLPLKASSCRIAFQGLLVAPGRQERSHWTVACHRTACKAPEAGKDNWTAWEAPGRHQGGRKGPVGQPERHQGGRKGLLGRLARYQGGRQAIGRPASQLDRLQGTREAPGRQERSHWTAWRHSLQGTREAGKDNGTACKAPGRQERTT